MLTNANRTKATMRTHLRNIVGLAISNPHVVGANFEASHILHACESFAKTSGQYEIACTSVPILTIVTTGGHCLTGQEEQQAAIGYLQEVEKNMGWHVQHIVDHLQEQWRCS
jgi:hypothetical protein